MFQKLILNKIESAVKGFLKDLDLDKDGKADPEQLAALFAALSSAVTRVIESIDQETLAKLIAELSALADELKGVIDGICQSIDKPAAAAALKDLKDAAMAIIQFIKLALNKGK
jgi:DNA-binding FrmR family transcriptional regulator